MKERGSGILLHISSLPSRFGIGDFGASAYKFVDFLSQAHQKYWQILPLSPTDTIYYNSPYHGLSAFALNPLLVSPDLLLKEGMIDPKDLKSIPSFSSEKVDYLKVTNFKKSLIDKACARQDRFKKSDYKDFCRRNKDWLDDYALFTALNRYFKGIRWNQWPKDIQDKQKKAVRTWGKTLEKEIESEKFIQHILSKQWISLKEYCNKKGISIIGDLPIYVDYNSADLWSNPRIFKLDKQKNPYVVAGVPPDYFSKTGQLWGNPVYHWEELRKTKYDWWIRRFKRVFSLYDIVRIDHFRGLVAYWEIPSKEKTAVKGKWVNAPVEDFFDTVLKKIGNFPVIAEDLGIITPDVVNVMNKYHFPRMKVLLFAFGGDMASNPYIPHNHVQNCILYTGTHDNNTARGWFEKEATTEEKKNLFEYLGRKVTSKEVSWELIQTAMASVANTVVIPMQDFLSLGKKARMNNPSFVKDNWEWRLSSIKIRQPLIKCFKESARVYGRTR
ncbi:MAG: 4-alpha-glucanotransferase [Candidatus Aceula meridiana]|nr:4-alpha-glucanotransferase [Candidatus Aceula meridiana]